MITAIKERCPQDHLCPQVSACPVGAINQTGWGPPSIDHEKCIMCGICTSSCPHFVFVPELEEKLSLQKSA
jgi:ferredoxin